MVRTKNNFEENEPRASDIAPGVIDVIDRNGLIDHLVRKGYMRFDARMVKLEKIYADYGIFASCRTCGRIREECVCEHNLWVDAVQELTVGIPVSSMAEEEMKTITARWIKEIRWDVDVRCPHCDYYYDWRELKIEYGANHKGTVVCEMCGEKFKVIILSEGEKL